MYNNKLNENSVKIAFKYAEKFCSKYPTWKIVNDLKELNNINKLQYGFISDKGKFHKRIDKIPKNDKYIMVIIA